MVHPMRSLLLLLAIENKVKPYYEHLIFYKGLSDWPEEWSGNNV